MQTTTLSLTNHSATHARKPSGHLSTTFPWRTLAVIAGVILGASALDRSYASTAGCLDTNFNPGANGTVHALLVQSDNKILVGGDFSQLAATAINNIGRLLSNGAIDWYGFAYYGASANGPVYAIALQSDGKVILGGSFTQVNGNSRSYLGRLNSNGSHDVYFAPSLNGNVYAIKVQVDGKILIGGDFTNIDGYTRSRIARLNSNGTVETGFSPSTDTAVYAIELADSSITNSDIVIGGNFGQVNGVNHSWIARLSSSGTRDGNFPASGYSGLNGNVLTLTMGHYDYTYPVFAGGAFTTFQGTSRPYNVDIDTYGLAVGGVGANDIVESSAFDGDKILFGGEFTSIGSDTRTCIARRAPSSTSNDANFVPPTISGTGASVKAIGLQSTGDIIIGGTFTNINGAAYSRLARLKASCD
jgi:uncharacterized delta-60 repeat protein